MSRNYQETYPTSQDPNSTYPQNKSLDFLISIPTDKEFVKGSLKVHGELLVRTAGGKIDTSTRSNLFFDEIAGIHSFFNNWTTKIESVGQTETISQYGRVVREFSKANMNMDERMSMSSHNMELRTGSVESTNSLMNGFVDIDGENKIPFSFKPMIFINRSTRNYTGSEVPQIKINVTLQDPSRCLFGSDNTVAKNITYSIKNLKLSYSVDDVSDHAGMPLMFSKVDVLQASINSQLANIEHLMAIPAFGVASSVILTTNYNDRTYNNNSTDYINISNLKYLVNDKNGQLVSYELTDPNEIVQLYVNALKLGNNELDSLRPGMYKNIFGFGINFDGVLPQNQKLTIQIRSDADAGAGRTYDMFSVINGLVAL